MSCTVLRIKSILIRIRILDPQWKKIDPIQDPGYFFFNEFFNKAEFSKSYFFSLIFMLKLDEPFRNQKVFIISIF